MSTVALIWGCETEVRSLLGVDEPLANFRVEGTGPGVRRDLQERRVPEALKLRACWTPIFGAAGRP